MGGRASVVAAIVGILFAGCSLDRVEFSGALRSDAGTLPQQLDAGGDPIDGGGDPIDGGVTPDAHVEHDGGGTCEARCDGNRAIRCEDGVEVVEQCDAVEDRCVVGSEGPTCETRVCVPNAVRCDESTLYTCDANGETETPTTCPHGCAAGACSPAPSCPWGGDLEEIVDEGTYAVDLCGRNDDHDVVDGSCEGATGNGEDTVVRLVVTTRRRIRVELRDIDSPAIDTVLSIRRTCDQESSQLACDDDVDCNEADDDLRANCESGRQPRQSRIQQELDPGTYYLMLDTDNRDAFRCGRVELRVRTIGG